MSIYERRENEANLLDAGHETRDVLFINERYEEKVLQGEGPYVHCTFANISFKDATLKDITFEDCVFIGCYFRRTKLDSCSFPASRFVDCLFSKPQIFSCSFAYARFSGSPVEYDYIRAAIRGEHNLRRDLAANLAKEAQVAGHGRDARQFRLDAIDAHEAFLRAGYRHETEYYRTKFQGLDQFVAWLQYWASRLNGLVWGYGERGWPLFRNLAIVALLVAPVLLLLSRSGLRSTEGGSVGVADCWYLSLANVLNNTSLSGVLIDGGWARLISTVESAVGIISLGLFVTLLFRAVTRR